jgi:Domain of unknown function (DUF222)/HNH endonuclease
VPDPTPEPASPRNLIRDAPFCDAPFPSDPAAEHPLPDNSVPAPESVHLGGVACEPPLSSQPPLRDHPPTGFGSRLAAARAAVADLAAAADELDDAPDGDVSAIMADLTTLVCQVDGLRVAVTGLVRRRELYRQRGAGSVTGWLRQDPRLADQAGHLSRLANQAARLPKISAALTSGQASLSQVGTASWQISQLPDIPERPADNDPDATIADSDGTSTDPDEELWAGLWRSGDVHAAADELFARFLPRLDADQLRIMGAHLREAADAQDRACDDYNAYAKRALRITRLLGDSATISGHLHSEAAEQIIAAFEELSAKTSPDDARTKPQRWADALAYLASLITPTPAPEPPTPAPEAAASAPEPPAPAPQPAASAPGTPAPASAPGTPASASEPAVPSGPGGAAPETARGASRARSSMPEPAGPATHWPIEPDDEPSPDGGHGHPHTDAQEYARPTEPKPAVPAEPVPTPPGERPPRTDGQPCPPGTSENPDPPGTSEHPHPPRTGGGPGSGAPGLRRPRVIVTVPLTTLLGYPLAPGAVLGNGTPLTAEAARRLACDADIVRLITHSPGPPGESGTPQRQDATAELTGLLADALDQLPRPLGGPSAALDIGRQSQSWTPRQRDALYGLYGGRCAKPGCTRPMDVIHHIVHWLYGGKTQVTNGAPLCLYDHWLVHEGGWRITRDHDGGLAFIPPPPGWRPGTLFRHGKPLPDTAPQGTAPQGSAPQGTAPQVTAPQGSAP